MSTSSIQYFESSKDAVFSVQWGRVSSSEGGEFKDALLCGGLMVEWDWRATDMHHNPGVRVEDIEALFTVFGCYEKPSLVIISCGFDGVLRVGKKTLDHLKERGIEVHVMSTPKAMDLYNKKVKELGNKVMAMMHSTC